MIKIKLCILVLFTLILFFDLIPNVFASENINCPNRFVTLVNPVRGRELWQDKSLTPLQNQYNEVKSHDFAASWLLQYDTFFDRELVSLLKKFDNNQEKGVFLEISPKLAQDSRVIYAYDSPWFSPKVIFLSGYTQSERKRLIDQSFQKFYQTFGYYPKSVGAWWIDSYSLNYLKEKYQINSAMIVADQKTTDSYGVWGQWWGVPYYPSKANILTPASSLTNKQNLVIVQWAQRDIKALAGEGPEFSNYSLQANDYIRQGKDTKYFEQLAKVYLNCDNPIGQVTIGLETGIESVDYINEYKNQLDSLKSLKDLQFVTMSEFAEKFNKVYPQIPKIITLKYPEATWYLTPEQRINSLGSNVLYNQNLAFADYFIADKSNFLNRILPQSEEVNKTSELKLLPWLTIFLIGIVSLKIKKFTLFLITLLFNLAAYGLILRSTTEYGWGVYYGPWFPNIFIIQSSILIITFLLFLSITKFKKNISMFFLWLIPLSFGLDILVQNFRFSLISGKYYFGFLLDPLRFMGLTFSKDSNLEIFNQDLPAYLAAGLMKLDYNKIWDNLGLSLVAYPLVHLSLASLLWWILGKLPKNIRLTLITILVVLFIMFVYGIAKADPRVVSRIN